MATYCTLRTLVPYEHHLSKEKSIWLHFSYQVGSLKAARYHNCLKWLRRGDDHWVMAVTQFVFQMSMTFYILHFF